MKTNRKFFLALISALGLLAVAGLFSSAAGAAPYSYQITIGASNAAPAAGATIAISGADATPNASVSVDVGSVHIGTVTATAAGTYTVNWTIPSDGSVCGPVSVTATDMANKKTATTTVTVTCAGVGGVSTGPSTSTGGGQLSATGVAVASIGTLGAVLILGGALVLIIGRRRGVVSAE